MHLRLPGAPTTALSSRAEPLGEAPTTAPSVRWRAAVVTVALVLLSPSVVLGTLIGGGAHGGARSSKNAGSPSQPHPKPSA